MHQQIVHHHLWNLFPHIPQTILIQQIALVRSPVGFTSIRMRAKHIIALSYVSVV